MGQVGRAGIENGPAQPEFAAVELKAPQGLTPAETPHGLVAQVDSLEEEVSQGVLHATEELSNTHLSGGFWLVILTGEVLQCLAIASHDLLSPNPAAQRPSQLESGEVPKSRGRDGKVQQFHFAFSLRVLREPPNSAMALNSPSVLLVTPQLYIQLLIRNSAKLGQTLRALMATGTASFFRSRGRSDFSIEYLINTLKAFLRSIISKVMMSEVSREASLESSASLLQTGATALTK